jgi:hypothetical protein
MAHLFEIENGIAKPTTETLMISPYKDIWERDGTADKSIAIKEFTFIEFMCSKKKTNPYAGYDDELRLERLKALLFDEDWTMDALVEAALVKLHDFQTEASETYRYYISTVRAAEKLRDFFDNFDIMEVNERGALLYKPADITRAINDTDKVLQNLNSMKEKVEQELFEQTKTRGNKQINPFEI